MERKYWALLALGILIMIGYTYSLDIPQEIQTPLQQDPYNFTTEQFNLIYFSTFILVTFLVIPIGIGIDRFPTSLSIIVLLALGLISQTVIGLLLQERINGYIGLILLMRSLFGISGEGLITLQGYVISVFGKK